MSGIARDRVRAVQRAAAAHSAADRFGGRSENDQVGANGAAQELVAVEHPDLGQVTRVVARGDLLTGVVGEHWIQIAQRLVVDAVRVHRPRGGDGQ